LGRNIFISLAVHAMIFALAYFGLPSLKRSLDMVDVPISVEIVNISEKTNVPSKPKKVEPKAEKAKPKPPPPPVAPQGSVAPPPPPKPAPKIKESGVAVVVEPKPKEQPKEQPKPKPKPKEKPQAKNTQAPIAPRKPKPPNEFASVLKTLEALKKTPPPPKKPNPEKDFAKMMENALDKPNQRNDVGQKLTISEIDLVRQQIHRCWNLPAGAKDAHKMLISIRISMNPDGKVRTAQILDQSQMSSNPFYRAMAESALRAVLNPACQPFKLPPDKYERWKSMKLNFDPKEMFGL